MSDELAHLRQTNREGTAAAIVNHLAAAETADAAGDDNEAKWHRGEAAKLQLRGQPVTIPLIDWPPFWAQESTGSFLVDPLLPKGRQVVLYAPAKAGKSELALWTGARAATGQDLFGNSIEPVTVLYLDLEMTEDDVKERLDDFGYGPDTDLSQLCYSQHPGLPPLDTARGGEALESEITALGADLVIIDTLSKVVEGEENASDTYLAFARHTGNRLRSLGVAGLFLDHTGKDVSKGTRGSSAKNDHADAVYRLIQRDRGIVHLDLTHSRIGWLDPLTLRRTADEHAIRWTVTEQQAEPVGTSRLAALLVELGADADIGSNEAGRLLRDNGHKIRRTNVLAAVRHLKHRGSGNHQNHPDPF